MTRYILASLVLLFFAACNRPEKTTTSTDVKAQNDIANDLVITPGGGIGKLTIGENAESVIKTLGKPDAGDAAMGSQMMIWYDKQDSSADHRITVFAHRPMGGPDEAISQVKAIRVNSPKYSTINNVHVGLPIADIKRHFGLKITRSSGIIIYTDNNSGIAFETDAQQICTAIVVFARGGLVDTYLNMRE